MGHFGESNFRTQGQGLPLYIGTGFDHLFPYVRLSMMLKRDESHGRRWRKWEGDQPRACSYPRKGRFLIGCAVIHYIVPTTGDQL